ncbi:MAG TPA: hypothetical protein IAA57_07385 [Candidatus Pullilachnospira intestinigallinarum]|nr:hypothetical protein [Candidatus Pullilachnospira intestinigallinarum]
MASRLMHLAISREMLRQRHLGDFDRFFLGSILPDACGPGVKSDESHLKFRLKNGSQTSYRLSAFRAAFSRELKQKDGLYLGYYFHLVQDLLYRNFIYKDCGWSSRIPGYVEKLHHDYVLLNSHLVRGYEIPRHIVLPEAFDQEPVCSLFPFQARWMLEELEKDFSNAGHPEEKPYFFTETLADEYIGRAVEFCIIEADALDRGYSLIDEAAWAWDSP